MGDVTAAQVDGPSFWRFELWDETDSRVDDVILRLAPQSIEVQRPIRSQVSQDLQRAAVVVQDGIGLARWSLSGTHGAGLNAILLVDGQGEVSGGLAARNALLALFERYAEENVQRVSSGEPLLRMVLTIYGGGPTEVSWEQWLIQPDELPRDRRNAVRPLGWDWSLGFWGLQRLSDAPSAPSDADAQAPLSPDDLGDVDDELSGIEDEFAGAVDSPRSWTFASLKADLQAGLQAVISTRNGVQSMLSGIKSDVLGLADIGLSLAQQATAIIRDLDTTVEDVRDGLTGDLAELRQTAMQARFTAGRLVRAAQVGSLDGSPTFPVARPHQVHLQQGDTLQSIAARELGDSSRWTELVALNGLVYPFLDFSGTGGVSGVTPAPGLVGKVLGQGSTLLLPLPSDGGASRPQDPIGLDLREDGGTGVVGGRENLVAALLRRLRTPKGWLPQHPEYGSTLYRIPGGQLSISTALDARRETARVLALDPRVIRVDFVRVRVDGDALWIEAGVVTVLGSLEVSGSVVRGAS